MTFFAEQGGKMLVVTGVLFCVTAQAQFLDEMGATTLQALTTNLNGSGIHVAQPEAYDPGTTNFEVNPGAVSQPASLFKYLSSAGTSTSYPNTLSAASGHAAGVASYFYAIPTGVATNVAHVDNFEASFFYNSYIAMPTQPSIGDVIVSQSFTFGPQTVSQQQMLDSEYDNYSMRNQVLFISPANNYGAAAPSSTNVCPPGTSYNCICVGAYQDGTVVNSLGPTPDNGRCKPDITASASETSWSTPQVAGAAAVLMQAGLRGDGGADTNSASDMRTIKALLLNGAVKPLDWTNYAPSPLDYRYGAGMVNIFNAYEQLAGGKHSFIFSNSVPDGGPHPPTGAPGAIGSLNGWDFDTISSQTIPLISTNDGVAHYYFNVSNNVPGSTFSATATLVWNRQLAQSAINNLNLFLYNALSSNLVAASTSVVDNVEHIWVPQLPQGRYDLQVLKSGGSSVSASETYALAFAFNSMELSVAYNGTNTTLTWPPYPDGYQVETTASLSSPIWTTNQLPSAVLTNGWNTMVLPPAETAQFFRLQQMP